MDDVTDAGISSPGLRERDTPPLRLDLLIGSVDDASAFNGIFYSGAFCRSFFDESYITMPRVALKSFIYGGVLSVSFNRLQ